MNQLTGVIIVSVSTVFYAILYPLIKKANQQLPPFTIMAISMFVLFVISLLASILFENGLHLKAQNFRETILILIAVGVLNFIGFWLVILGYKYFPVWQLTMFSLLTPILAGIFAYFILGEKITNNLFIGLAITAVGLFVALRP